ncbi:MAG: FumA C-terminus/TtdB family hydratase beta subunit [Candidatus Promineifilaceae bacterium]|nr:FumA C-terminus/TtdB family hydratase beta subunit [Candidatus Promineifilaceae bacterium]
MPRLTTPISDADIAALHVGDTVLLNGLIVTGRDAAHKFMVEQFIRQPVPEAEAELYSELRTLLDGGVIYHCGPVVKQHDDGSWSFVAAGPTTSIREEVYEPAVIAHFNLKGVIGKGGMGPNTLRACQEQPAVYFHAIGGAASLIARSVKEVVTVHKLEFGVPEAMWVIRVEDFPVVVTMDSHGQSIHDEVEKRSEASLTELLAV